MYIKSSELLVYSRSHTVRRFTMIKFEFNFSNNMIEGGTLVAILLIIIVALIVIILVL